MEAKEYCGRRLRVVPLTGQYDPTKLINLGTNRWALKPELGYSRRWDHWLLDTYGGAWFYTTESRVLLFTISFHPAQIRSPKSR